MTRSTLATKMDAFFPDLIVMRSGSLLTTTTDNNENLISTDDKRF